MSANEDQIKRIQEKLRQLLKRQEILQKENSALKEELSHTNRQAIQHHEMIDRLKQQVEILKLSNGEMNGTEKKQFEKRINTYLKEIDRCIAMLST
jgi:chromosome segregation ATPase